jgi:hypothetical protein
MCVEDRKTLNATKCHVVCTLPILLPLHIRIINVFHNREIHLTKLSLSQSFFKQEQKKQLHWLPKSCLFFTVSMATWKLISNWSIIPVSFYCGMLL